MPDRSRRVSSNKCHRQTLSKFSLCGVAPFSFADELFILQLPSSRQMLYLVVSDISSCTHPWYLIPRAYWSAFYVLRAACGELASGTRVALNTAYDSSSLFVFHTCLHCSTVQVSVRLCHLQADSVNLDRGVHGHSHRLHNMVMCFVFNLSALCPREVLVVYSSTMYTDTRT